MSKITKEIPISKAKEIASNFGYDEVIIFGANYETGAQHVTTYGTTQMACENAAKGGNTIKKLLGWPEDKCNAKPSRQLKRENMELRTFAHRLINIINSRCGDDTGVLHKLSNEIKEHIKDNPVIEEFPENIGREIDDITKIINDEIDNSQ